MNFLVLSFLPFRYFNIRVYLITTQSVDQATQVGPSDRLNLVLKIDPFMLFVLDREILGTFLDCHRLAGVRSPAHE